MAGASFERSAHRGTGMFKGSEIWLLGAIDRRRHRDHEHIGRRQLVG